MSNSYDVVVIGSGFGGAIVACRLAAATDSRNNRKFPKICVIERGKEHPKNSFLSTPNRSPTSIAALLRFGLKGRRHAVWNPNGGPRRFGPVEFRSFDGVDVIQGCGVGGGSLHYYNVSLEAPAAIFDEVPRSVADLVLRPQVML